ncbi:MAG: VOC family protein [Sulfitobacter sp.]
MKHLTEGSTMPQSPAPKLHRLDHFVLTVADMAATISFYTWILGMRSDDFTTPDGSVRHALFYGNCKINLHRQGSEFDPKAAHPTPGSADLCFLTETPLATWVTHLSRHKVEIEEGPVPRTGATGPLTSIYVRDPDRNLIEISISDQRA